MKSPFKPLSNQSPVAELPGRLMTQQYLAIQIVANLLRMKHTQGFFVIPLPIRGFGDSAVLPCPEKTYGRPQRGIF
jgi:hypothetical protein